MTALDDDIRFSRGHSRPPEDRAELLKWVESPKNLDLVAEAFRRVCSGYVSTGLLFAVRSGPLYMDWPAVVSMLKTAHDTLYRAYVYMDIGGRGKLSEEVAEVERMLDTIKSIESSVKLADLCATLPYLEDRARQEAEE